MKEMILKEPDFSEEYLARISAPTYIVSGENDIMYLTDAKYLHENIADSRMTVVKGADHSSYVCDGRGYRLAADFFNDLKGERK